MEGTRGWIDGERCWFITTNEMMEKFNLFIYVLHVVECGSRIFSWLLFLEKKMSKVIYLPSYIPRQNASIDGLIKAIKLSIYPAQKRKMS